MSEADHTVLKFDWETVEDREVTAVLGQSMSVAADGSARWQAVALVVGDQAVTIAAHPDTDELMVRLAPPPATTDWQPLAALAGRVGRRLGWCWIGMNSHGYLDSFTLAFDGIDPDCLFVGEASEVLVKTLAAAGP